MKQLIAYPNLRNLMGKYSMTKQDIASVIGLSYRNTLKKLSRQKTGKDTYALFNIDEVGRLVDFFKAKGETVTVYDIFLR